MNSTKSSVFSTITRPLNTAEIIKSFPILQREVRPGVPLVYLDSAATSQKPDIVIDVMDQFYRRTNSNIHRGIHTLAEESTADYEAARNKIAQFVGIDEPREIIFTRNTTESINLVAQTWGRTNLGLGDTVLLTEMEHHSNIVPWQMLSSQTGVKVKFVPVFENGLLDMEAYARMLEEKPKLVAFTHMSNVLGTINPVNQITEMAHHAGSVVLVDGAQAVPHMKVDIADLDADFYAFSGHKMCGPTGIGILFGKRALLEEMPPFMGGGDMIKRVRFDGFSPNSLPYKFEAGTPAIAEAIGLGAAVDFLTQVGMDRIQAHEHQLAEYALERLVEIPGVSVFGPEAGKKGAVMAFHLPEAHAHDISQVLDYEGIAVRAGHHCAMPLHEKYEIPATARASFYLYNSLEEVDKLVEGIYKVKELFG